MFTSIDENTFRQAIRDKDYLALKVSTVSTMLDDPTFERGETVKAIQILKEQVPEIFEDEVKLDYEERLEKSEWNKRCFTKLTYWFQENFAISRISYIREVGRVVHRDTAMQYKQSMAMNKPVGPKSTPSASSKPVPEKQKTTSPKTKASKPNTSVTMMPNTTKKNEASKKNFSVARAIVAVVLALVLVGFLLLALVLVIFLLLKLL